MRYCEPCDEWVPDRQRICKACGADTVKAEPEREKGDDDGREYADPRDEREERLRDW